MQRYDEQFIDGWLIATPTMSDIRHCLHTRGGMSDACFVTCGACNSDVNAGYEHDHT
jgi:hypothetical protein